MLKIFWKGVRIVPYITLVAISWASFTEASDPPLAVVMMERGEVPLLYNHLSQNIEQEAGHYSEYIDYRKNLRLKDFWSQLEQLNLNREEIIQTIAFLEIQMERPLSEGTYHLSSTSSIRSEPGYLSEVFSNWRPFYFLISGGFYFIIASLLLYYYCITCRQNILAMMGKGLKTLSSPRHFDLQKGTRHQGDALSCYRHDGVDFSYCITYRQAVLPTVIQVLKGLSAYDDRPDLEKDEGYHDDDFHKEAA